MIKRGLVCLLLVLSSAGLLWAISDEPANEQLSVKQGKCFSIVLPSNDPYAKNYLEFLDQKIKFYQDEDEIKAIVGVPPDQPTGVYPLFIKMTDINGEEQIIDRRVLVGKTVFPTVSFWLKPAKKKLLVSRAVVDEWAEIEQVLAKESPEQLWVGKFIVPVNETVSMVFGTQEYVNNKKRGQHRGLDLAAETGTEVMAANIGKVVFIKKLEAYGGTIVIDHGQGINSLYFHLSKFLCKVGDEVGQGDIIALSGNTGISSGSHLHWGMSVHNLRVDPMQWVKQEF
jgi:murein DD-endopeptidase MepM/ murein hydrolase activator NlpD